MDHNSLFSDKPPPTLNPISAMAQLMRMSQSPTQVHGGLTADPAKFRKHLGGGFKSLGERESSPEEAKTDFPWLPRAALISHDC